MKLQLEFNTDRPDENGSIFSESVFGSIIDNAENVPVFLGYDSQPIGVITGARKNEAGVELDARLDKTRPETEFFEKGHIVYSVSCSYKDMDFEQTGDVRIIKSAKLGTVTIEPGRKYPPTTTIFTMN